MKAIILAAGRSTRLYPITLEYPKCLLPFGEKTLIEHQISWLNMCGIDDILVVNGYLNHMIEEKLGSRVRYRFFENFAETNNLYTLHSINDELDDDVVILFSDVLLSVKLLQKCINSSEDFCLIVDKKNISDTTMFVSIKNGKIYDIGSHIALKEADGNFIGVAKFSKQGVAMLARQLEKMIQKGGHIQDYYTLALIDIANGENKVGYIEVEDNLAWMEIDLKEEYEQALAKGVSVYY
jgi:choline kinase